MKKSIVLLLIYTVIMFNQNLFAGEKPPVETFKNSFQVNVSFLRPILDFSIQYKKEDGSGFKFSDPIDYRTNTPLVSQIGIYYKSFGISFATDVADTTEDKNVYGKTEYFDLQLAYYTNSFSFEFTYQNYEGYYLDNPNSFGYSKGDTETLFPQLTLRNIGINVIYTFSDNFSLNAAMNQRERQNKWDWSFLLMGSINHFSINSDKSLVPLSEQKEYPNNTQYNGGEYTSIGISPGISITVPFYNFFISSAMFIGPGLMVKKFDADDGGQTKTGSFIHVNWKGAVGYNGDSFFTGMAFTVDSRTTGGFTRSDINIQTYSGYVSFFAGIRL